jgi:twitching motility protein PilT
VRGLALKKLAREIERPNGMIITTGPTGSGKTTTLYAILNKLNDPETKIITLEDPIEYKLKGINQSQIDHSKEYSFAAGLRSILRQDPDVVLVGEMRDLETVQAAITTAETGHLVFATLHTNTAVQTIDRIIDVFPPHHQSQIRTELSFVLEGVISQQLIPRVGGGRTLALETMFPTVAIRNLIRESKTHQIYSQMQMGQGATGMQTMNQTLARLVKSETISYEDGLSYCTDMEELKDLSGRKK